MNILLPITPPSSAPNSQTLPFSDAALSNTRHQPRNGHRAAKSPSISVFPQSLRRISLTNNKICTMDARRPQLPSQTASAFQLPTGSLIPPRQTASAPLPSPTSQQSQYFAPFPQSQMAPQYAQQQQQSQQPQQQQSQQQSSDYHYSPDRSASGSTAQETSTFIGNYALVAEAAKRAQMAVLMREMEGVELST